MDSLRDLSPIHGLLEGYTWSLRKRRNVPSQFLSKTHYMQCPFLINILNWLETLLSTCRYLRIFLAYIQCSMSISKETTFPHGTLKTDVFLCCFYPCVVIMRHCPLIQSSITTPEYLWKVSTLFLAYEALLSLSSIDLTYTGRRHKLTYTFKNHVYEFFMMIFLKPLQLTYTH